MKKLISYLLIASILLGCIAPAVVASASASPAIQLESVEKVQGTGTEVSLALSIVNNPGLSAISFVVYYDRTQLAIGSSDAFAGALASADDSSVSPEYAGTNTKVRSYIPSAVRSTSKAFVVELYGEYNDWTYETDAIVGDGVLVNIPLSLLATEFGSYEFNVVLIEAYDEEGEEIEFDNIVGTIAYVADPLVGIHDDFTVFTDPGDKEIVIGTKEISVDVRFDNNPGLWASRIFIAYPESLSLKSVENPLRIYTSRSDMVLGTLDLDLASPHQVEPFKDYLAAHPDIVKEGYRSTTIYFEPASYDAVIEGDGVLCTLNFDIASDVEIDDVIDINIYYTDADFIRAELDENGMPVFTLYKPETKGANLTMVDIKCDHVEGDVLIVDPECERDGVKEYKCALCGRTVRSETIPATGHSYQKEGAIVTYLPTCTADGYSVMYCDNCDHVERIFAGSAHGHDTAGAVETVEPTCVLAGTRTIYCNTCGEISKVESITPTGIHSLIFVDTIDATCTQNGYESYWCCTVCGGIFLDSEGKVSSNLENLVILAKGHTEDKGVCSVCGERDVVPDGLVYTISNGEAYITGYNGKKTELYIPAAIAGCPVTLIHTAVCESGVVSSIFLSESMEKTTIFFDRYNLGIDNLYVLRADMELNYRCYYDGCDDFHVTKLFYTGTNAEYEQYIGYNVTRLIYNYRTPMEGFSFMTNEDAGTITVTGYNGLYSDLVMPAEYNGYRVTAIAPGAFMGKQDITSISIPGTIEFIEENTFKDCINLRSVSLGEGVCEIGDHAFSGCSSLEEIILPESVAYIWMYAFNKCVGLTKVYFPSCLEIIEYKAFYRCENIYDVTYNGSPSEFDKIYLGNGNDPILMTDINYLEEDEAKIVMIPVPEGMDPEDCQLYYVDENGVATALQVEFVDGHFVVVETAGQEEMTGYYIVRNSTGDEPDEPEIPDIPSDVVIGDVDGDGIVNSLDANVLCRIISGIDDAPADSDNRIAADINRDGQINAADANMFKRLIAGVITI